MKSLLLNMTLLAGAFAVSAQTAYIDPTPKDIDNVADKITRKIDKTEAEVRKIIIKKCLNDYLAVPATKSDMTSATLAEATDSARVIERRIESANRTLLVLTDSMGRLSSSRSAMMDDLAARRDSLARELAALQRDKAATDSLIAAADMESEALAGKIVEMTASVDEMSETIGRAGRIKDAATARRSQTASVIDQLSVIERDAIHAPLEGDFTSLLNDARELYTRNRDMIATYGNSIQQAQAAEMVAHIETLDGFSLLIAKARSVMAAKYDARALQQATQELDGYYREHGLSNPSHIDAVRSTLYQLKEGPACHARFLSAVDALRTHGGGWLIDDDYDRKDFDAIIASIGEIPPTYTTMIAARDNMVKKMLGATGGVVTGSTLTSILDNAVKQL